MKYFVIFLCVMFSGCLLLCMNSTENRQLMVDVDASLRTLNKQAITDSTSKIALEIYRDCVRRFVPTHINHKQACEKLIELGLCRFDQGTLIAIEYYIDDRLPMLERKAQIPRGFSR